jgi:beta propeller repeat protein
LKRYRLIGLLTIVIITSTMFIGLGVKPVRASSIQFSEGQVTSNIASQENPDIYEYGPMSKYIIVWQDNRNGNWDIYMYAVWLDVWHPEIRVTTSLGNEINPKIFNDTIVYQSDRNGNWDIYAYNITSKLETQITHDPASQQNPVIDGNHIVWQDNRNGHWAIYLYDLEMKTEQVIIADWHDNYDPAISGNRIIFVRFTPTNNHYLSTYDISTKEINTIAVDYKNPIAYPEIHGDIAVWSRQNVLGFYLLPYWDVYTLNLATGQRWSTLNEINEVNPDVYGQYFVFERYASFGSHWVYLYNFDNGEENRIVYTASNQIRPAISAKYGNYIVYMDNRNGNWDIYLTAFGYVQVGVPGPNPIPPQPITPSKVIGELQQTKSWIADTSQILTSDFAGANDKVRENRRNAMINQLDFAITSIQAAVDAQDLQVRKAKCQNAIDQLNDLISKVDGWTQRGAADIAGSGYTPDWITAPLYMDQTISSYRTELQTLYDHIS